MSNTETQDLNENIAWSLRPILIVAGIVIFAGAIYAAITSVRTHKETDARNALFRAEKTYSDEIKPMMPKEDAKAAEEEGDDSADDTKGDKKADTKSKKAAAKKAEAKKKPSGPSPEFMLFNVNEKLPKSLSAFEAVGDKFPGTRSGYEALLRVADLYRDHGNSEASITWYNKALSNAPETFDSVLTLQSLAASYENTGKLADAKTTLEKAIQKGETTLKPDLMLNMARIQELMKDSAGAKKTYEDVISQFPKTHSASLAEERKGTIH